MKHLKSYIIQFSGLSFGKHEFTFDIDKRFFDSYEYSIVKDGNLTAEVVLDRQPTMMLVDFHIKGTVQLTCDVCLKEFDGDVDIDANLIVKFTDQDLEEITDDIIVLSRNEHEFSVADLLYEHINLSIPHYVRCDEQGGDQTCDEEMIAMLQNLEPKIESEEPSDPRWEMLKKLKKK